MKLKYTEIPSLAKWRHDSSVALATRNHDAVLVHIDGLIDDYNKRRREPTASVIACDLLMSLDYWLKMYKKNPRMENRRAPAVQALFECVAYALCRVFKCEINALPRELEWTFGRELSDVGINVDIRETLDCKAYYLDRSELPLYRLWFKGGLAYQWQWWTTPSGPRVLAESSKAYSRHAGAYTVGIDYAFFVMSMGRDIYMMKHGQVGKTNYRTFHSSYLAGGAVMAAGSMLIRRGVIKRIRSDSGHYKPTPTNMLALLQALQMLGVNLSEIVMEDHMGWPVGSAPEFFRKNAKWDALMAQRSSTIEANKGAFPLRSKPREKEAETGPYQVSGLTD
jgi:hypothetical protein